MPFKLPALIEEVENALRPGADAARLLDVVTMLRGRPRLLRAHLALLRSCDACVERAAKRSSWHENGFAKIRLARRSGCSVRMHVWPPGGGERGDVDPHGHRWEFASWVAVGEGVDEAYFAEEAPDDPSVSPYTRYDFGSADGPRVMRKIGPSRLRRLDGVRHLAGSTYACLRDVVHTVAPVGSGLVATVVVQGPVVLPSAPVYVPPRPESRTPRPMTAAELQDLLREVDARLTADEPDESLEVTR